MIFLHTPVLVVLRQTFTTFLFLYWNFIEVRRNLICWNVMGSVMMNCLYKTWVYWPKNFNFTWKVWQTTTTIAYCTENLGKFLHLIARMLLGVLAYSKHFFIDVASPAQQQLQLLQQTRMILTAISDIFRIDHQYGKWFGRITMGFMTPNKFGFLLWFSEFFIKIWLFRSDPSACRRTTLQISSFQQ